MGKYIKEPRAKRSPEQRKNDAQSFRLGAAAITQLREVAEWLDLSQADVIRMLVAREHKRQKERRAAAVESP